MLKFFYPWDRKDWQTVSQQILSPVNSVFDFDSRIQKRVGVDPRAVINTFEKCGYGSTETTKTLINEIISAAKKVEAVLRKFPHALAGPGNIELTRGQLRAIIAGIFVGVFEKNMFRGADLKNAGLELEDCPMPSFAAIWRTNSELFLKSLLTYFIVTSDDPKLAELPGLHFSAEQATAAREYYRQFMKQKVIFHRVFKQPPDWTSCEEEITSIAFGSGNVDESPANFHIVPCKPVLCEDMLKSSPTTEEITMAIRPEVFAALIFCPHLRSDVLCVIGSAKFSLHSGIGSSSRWNGVCRDNITEGPVNTHALVFMDNSPGSTAKSQFLTNFPRDLAKAYCGYASISGPVDAAASHWIYAHNPYDVGLKLVQQIVAASAAKKNLIYHVHQQVADEISKFILTLNDMTITVTRLLGVYFQAYEEERKEHGNVRLSENNILNRMVKILNCDDED